MQLPTLRGIFGEDRHVNAARIVGTRRALHVTWLSSRACIRSSLLVSSGWTCRLVIVLLRIRAAARQIVRHGASIAHGARRPERNASRLTVSVTRPESLSVRGVGE